ncbi:DNA/RNA non-specific endonuclease [Synoicihabitans lomoniglobus]|uniref:DNA/RNA non-specific endonuclease n=1 Tax=Synoicihabitans lomoniglobus TaxID=2909285 RepID=A0AAE9ZWS1_9BACT|nr:DNA/RNA non-specific endonuclease [Opitutaceae bacterium LMO-M01]WED64856.1 DNA/RNA non-specific endonuclease [Opitutaceae bacterium LMO-M01]
MARRSTKSSRSKIPRSFRRTKFVLWLNVIVLAVGGVWFLLQPPVRQAEVRLLVGNAFARDKHVAPLDVAWDLYQLYYSPDYVTTPPAPGDRTHLFAGVPRGPDATPAGRLLTNTGYLVGYADSLASPLWAAYRLTDLSPLPDAGERPDKFNVDERTIARVTSDDFTHTGYDRGHLAPNYGIATRYGDAAQLETFLMSNVIPQKHGLNAGLWKQLEMKIATSYPARFGEVWVLAGPVFGAKPARLPGRGRARPAIPEACYMIIIDESDGRVRAQAFLFPSEPVDGISLDFYVTTIDDIEYRTGLDFLADLPDDAETTLESKPASRVW